MSSTRMTAMFGLLFGAAIVDKPAKKTRRIVPMLRRADGILKVISHSSMAWNLKPKA
jgi:hypothetical protein